MTFLPAGAARLDLYRDALLLFLLVRVVVA